MSAAAALGAGCGESGGPLPPALEPAPAAGPSQPPAPAPTRQLRGRVVDQRGLGVLGTRLQLTGQPGETVAEPDGNFSLVTTLTGPEAGDLRISAPGFAPLAIPVGELTWPLILQLDQGGSIHGHVSLVGMPTPASDGDPSDAPPPLATAEVWLAGSGLWPPERIQVDDDGRFQRAGLDPGIYELAARLGPWVAPGHHRTVLEAGEERTLDVHLEPGASLAVTVRDGAGDGPIDGARVVARTRNLVGLPISGTTDSAGMARLEGLAPGPWSLSVEAEGFVPALATAGAGTGSARVALQRGARLRGQVVDGHGRGIAGADITAVLEGTSGPAQLAPTGPWSAAPSLDLAPLFGDSLGVTVGAVPPLPVAALSQAGESGPGRRAAAASATSGPDGRFALVGLPAGRLQVFAQHPEWAPTASAPIQTQAGAAAESVVLRLREPGVLRVRVVDADGEPAHHLPLRLSGPSEWMARSGVSDGQGEHLFDGVVGTYTVSAPVPGLDHVTAKVSVPPGAHRRVTLRLPDTSHRLAGRVFGPLGQPVADARVAVFAAGGRATTPLAQVWSAGDGGFEAAGLPPPPYGLTIDHVDYAQARLAIEHLEEPLSVRLSPGRRVQGQLSEQGTGRALSGVQVLLQDDARTWVATSEKGRFAFQNISPGEYDLSTRSDAHEDVSLPWQVPEDGAPQPDLELELVRLGGVSGVVVDRLGQPLSQVRVTWVDGQGAHVWTDRRGHFHLGSLPPGPVRLRAEHASAGTATTDDQALAVRSGETTPGILLRLPDVDRSPPDDAREPEGDEGAAHERPPEDAAPGPRLFTLPAIALRWDEGTVVAKVNSPGESALRVGDRLVAIDGEPVLSLAQARAMLRGTPGSRVVVRVRRGGQAQTLRLTRPGPH